tara:strand:+ start:739 stop:885 length:147 start_codon:yes stop_codon:yes gene_type:complete
MLTNSRRHLSDAGQIENLKDGEVDILDQNQFLVGKSKAVKKKTATGRR